MDKKLIFSYLQYMGWGDTLISLFDILNCTHYIKNKYPEIKIYLIINDNESKNIKDIFPIIFDENFFSEIFNDWVIQKKSFSSFCKENECKFNDEIFTRIYSGRNYDMNKNIPGIFDVYFNRELMESYDDYEIPFDRFTYDEDEDRSEIIDFPIFNKKLISEVDFFINKYLGDEFESIFYRIIDKPTKNDFDNFEKKFELIKPKFDVNKTYFISSNHGYCKKKMQEYLKHSVSYIPLDKLGLEEINCYDLNKNGYNLVFGSMAELLIHSKSSLIHHHSDYSWKSFFSWYPRNVKKIKDVLL